MHRGESKCGDLSGLGFSKVSIIKSKIIVIPIFLAHLECKYFLVFSVDLDQGVLIINYSMTARVVDNGEVVEDTKEHRKRFDVVLQYDEIG